ncbi:MAG: ABC transporter substrate-binding protein [Bacteroidetes bacterium]|nr:MAG: ABC transporter substrate-binding protein [Bacteroidota bacterium]
MQNIFGPVHLPGFERSLVALVIIGSISISIAQGQSSDELSGDALAIRTMLEDRDRSIKSILGSSDQITPDQREQLRGLVNDVIDFRAMGEGALGRYWSKISEEQQTEFVDVFSQIVRLHSLADTDVYRSGVVYNNVTVNGDEALVHTTTTYKSIATPVDYTLHKTAAGWLATDIILDEVSTVKGYARSFQSVIRKKGFDDLMVRLNKRLESERAGAESE